MIEFVILVFTVGTSCVPLKVYLSTYIIYPWWSSFPSIRPVIRPVIHPSKFLIPEEEDDGRGGGGRRRMAAAAVYPNILTIRNFFKTLKIETK
jgi:hypothetical protein